MVAKVGSVVVDIRTNTAKFNQGINRSQKLIGGFGNSIKKLTGILGIFAGATGLGYVIKQSLATADAIGKAADTVGLGIESFQELQHAAELAGTEQSQFTSNMTAFIKRVGEAKAGMGPLVSGLKNIDAELLKSLQATTNQEQALNLMADAIQKAGSETERAAIANAAFSRAGVGMTIFLKNGSEGLDKMRKRARDLGIIMGKDLVRDAEKANDRFNELTKTVSRKFTTVIVENSGTIETLIDSLFGLITIFGKVARASENAGKALFNFFNPNRVKSRFEELNDEIESSQKRMDLLMTLVQQSGGSAGDNRIIAMTSEFNALGNTIRKAREEQEALLSTAKAATEKNDAQVNGDQQPSPDQNTPVIDKARADAQARLTIIQESLLIENETKAKALEDQLFFAESAFQDMLITEQQRADVVLELTKNLENEKTRIAQEAEDKRKSLLTSTLSTTANILKRGSSLMKSEGKKQSATQKVLAKASIIASTAQAVMSGLATPPPPLGFALAAIMALEGAKNLSKVGGGSSSSVPRSISNSVTDFNDQPSRVTSDQNLPNKSTQVIFTGDMLGEDLSERLVDIIRNATNERDIVVFDSDSRQAQEIREAS